MINRIKGIRHPEAYHGDNAGTPFFEGWYHKIVTKSGHAIVIIPGIYSSEKVDNHFSFIMIFDGLSGKVHFERFQKDDFFSKTDSYNTIIGGNKFFSDGISLNIKTEDFSISGSVNFIKTYPWPVTIKEPGCMGWYAYLPIMECYHGILSMDHELSGELIYNGDVLAFNKGRGYIEKDWGKNFPTSWIWVQSNHFNNNKISLSASIARIPLLGTRFAGFIVGLLYQGELYRFTTYRSAKIVELTYDGSNINWVIEQKTLTLFIQIEIGKRAGILFAPDEKDMVKKVPEYLDSKVSIKLMKNNSTIVEDSSDLAANEIVGDIENLLELANKH